MKDIRWMVRRLRAMSPEELVWRVREKQRTRREKKEFYEKNLPVTEIPLPEELKNLTSDVSRLKLNWENPNGSLYAGMRMFGLYEETEWRYRWDAGFQTENTWPTEVYSPELSIGQRADIGDIRTNWELNRHFVFAMLAKSYYVSGDEQFLHELEHQFTDWNQRNLFLHGAEWTSAMELAIRVNSWVYAWCFLRQSAARWNNDGLEPLLDAMSHGILGMTAHIVRHRAHGSSANNHLIVELYAVGLAGLLYDFQPWVTLSVENLTRELPRQNTADGVNREMSTHYQAFVMEAYGLLAHQLGPERTPERWLPYLRELSRFLCDGSTEAGGTVIFGDDDGGKILDLTGRQMKGNQDVLQLMGSIGPERYTDAPLNETLTWLLSPEQQAEYWKKPMYQSPFVSVREEGGYTLLRSRDRKLVIAFDHAPLGFGRIAAHGHADALSIQVFFAGRCILTDPGTWNYHLSKELRDKFRSTSWHNTVCVDDENQSEILGPFLWGKRAETKLLEWNETGNGVSVTAQTAYRGMIHTRCLRFDGERTLVIEDTLTGAASAKRAAQNFSLAPGAAAETHAECCTVSLEGLQFCLTAQSGQEWETRSYEYSPHYDQKQQALQVCCVQPGAERMEFRTTLQF